MSAPRPVVELSPSADAFELEADTLRALAHPKRLMILNRLGTQAQSVTALASALGMSLPNASQHLRVLKDRGIVRAERNGQVVVYRLANPAFFTCCTLVRQVIVEESRRREAGLTGPPKDEGDGKGRLLAPIPG